MPKVSTPDGRTLAYQVRGDAKGVPVLYQHGVPGSRLRQPADPDLWRRLKVRAITYDRPGYGRSTRRPGRTVADCVADVLAIADKLRLDRFCVVGVSGGGPHALAVATAVPDRVVAAALVVPHAPVLPSETYLLMPTNREAHERARSGGAAAVTEHLGALRQRILANPVAAVLAIARMTGTKDAPLLTNRGTVRRSARTIAEGLRPGLGGWVDDTLALELDWGFTPQPVRCQTSVWYAGSDTATPAPAVRRLAETIQAGRVHEWPGDGHLAAALHEDEVLGHLLDAGGSPQP